MSATRDRVRSLVLILFSTLFFGCVLLYLYHPLRPRSLLGWVALFVIGIRSWALIEWMGSVVLEAPLFKRLSSFGRIALAVPVVIALSGCELTGVATTEVPFIRSTRCLITHTPC